MAGAASADQPARSARPDVHAAISSRGHDRGSALDAQADKLYDSGTEAKTNDDRHILSTVFFAAVLFLAAVSLRLEWRPLRIAVLAFGTIMFLGSLAFVLTPADCA